MHEFDAAILFVLGLSAGSFVNAWVWRTKMGLSMMERSCCPHCRRQLPWHDNIPLVGYFLLRGKCRHCSGKISPQYPIIEASLGALFVLFGWRHGWFITGSALVRDLSIVIILSCVFLYDYLYREIPDQWTILPAALLFAASSGFAWKTPLAMIIGIAAGAGFFLLQFLISRGRWVGSGDIFLGGFMGVILGWPLILVGLFLAYSMGAILSIVLLAAKRKTLSDATPFGTYLALGTLGTMLCGEQIVAWYSHLI